MVPALARHRFGADCASAPEYLHRFVQPAAILRYLADLASATATNGGSGLPDGVTPEMLDLTRTGEPAAWLGTDVQVPFTTADGGGAPGVDPTGPGPPSMPPTVRRTAVVRHLVALDALQPTARLLRLGWVTVAGTAEVAGKQRTVCFPLVSQPVRVPS